MERAARLAVASPLPVTGQLFHDFDERSDGLRDELKSDINRLYNSVNGIARRLHTDEAERGAMGHQLRRYEHWHQQAADKLGLKLDCQGVIAAMTPYSRKLNKRFQR
jgi:hypothetical protein